MTPTVSPNFKQPKPEAPERSPAQRRGATNRRKGMRKQRQGRKALESVAGMMAGRYSTQTGAEENWRLPWRVECKAGVQVKAIATAYRKAREQSDAAHAHGDPRPFVFLAMPDGVTWGLVTVRTDELAAFLESGTEEQA